MEDNSHRSCISNSERLLPTDMHNWIQLRRLIPLLILATFSLDLGSRILLPPERLAFRGWDAALLFRSGEGPFRPNFSYFNARAYGDLSNLGNVPFIRQYHSESFSTDPDGFRKTLPVGTAPTRILVVGDSFSAGAGLSDNETLCAQIA